MFSQTLGNRTTCLNCRPNLAKRVAGNFGCLAERHVWISSFSLEKSCRKFCCLVIENGKDMSELSPKSRKKSCRKILLLGNRKLGRHVWISSFSFEKSCWKFCCCGHVTSKEYSSKNANSRFYVGTSDFFSEIPEKLVPKTFSSKCMGP